MATDPHTNDDKRAEVLAELSARFPKIDLSWLGPKEPTPDEADPDTIGADEDVIAIMAPSRVDKARTLHTVLSALESPTEWLTKPDPLYWRDETTRVALYLCAEIARDLTS